MEIAGSLKESFKKFVAPVMLEVIKLNTNQQISETDPTNLLTFTKYFYSY
jgi:hypothetical protein